jgi:hypothetical protein
LNDPITRFQSFQAFLRLIRNATRRIQAMIVCVRMLRALREGAEITCSLSAPPQSKSLIRYRGLLRSTCVVALSLRCHCMLGIVTLSRFTREWRHPARGSRALLAPASLTHGDCATRRRAARDSLARREPYSRETLASEKCATSAFRGVQLARAGRA